MTSKRPPTFFLFALLRLQGRDKNAKGSIRQKAKNRPDGGTKKKKKGFANPQRTFGIYKQQHAYGTIFTALKHYATNNDKSANKTSMKKQLLKAASWYSFKTINHA